MNSSTVLLLPISHRILAQRKNGPFGSEQVLQSKRQLRLSAQRIHESVKAWKKGETQTSTKERER
jgi:hypothetical protein